MWGLRYIDDAVLRRIKSLGFGGGGSFATYYHITDLQFSSVVMLKSNATLVERNAYDAYGNARHRWAGDFNNDGLVNAADQTLLNAALTKTIGLAGYNADIDLDRNGAINAADNTLFLASQAGANVLAVGQISDPAGIDAVVGYSGYLFNSETKLYHVRFRCYSPDLGKWIERDPIDYVDGMNLYQYSRSRPTGFIDSSGLHSYDYWEWFTFGGYTSLDTVGQGLRFWGSIYADMALMASGMAHSFGPGGHIAIKATFDFVDTSARASSLLRTSSVIAKGLIVVGVVDALVDVAGGEWDSALKTAIMMGLAYTGPLVAGLTLVVGVVDYLL